jgi:Alginate export
MKKSLSIALVLLLLPVLPSLVNKAQAQAQDKDSPRYTVQGQVRHRFESSARTFDSEIDAINFNLLRTRLGVNFYGSKSVEAFIQFQDSRVMGEESSTLADGSAERFDLHQGYLKLNDLFSAPVDLQIGRFEANYGSQRLIGAVGWHNIGRSFDGFRATIHPENMSIEVFNFKVVEEIETGDEGDLNLYGANGDFKLIKNYKTQAFVLWQRAQPTDELSRYTAGLFISGASGNFKPEIELAYQAGTREAIDVAAFMVTVNLGYTFSSAQIKPTISVGIDYLSGDDDPTDGTYKVFDTMYATNHKFYGYMDYFLNIPVNTMGLGLNDIHVKAGIKATDELAIRLAIHTFLSSQEYTLANGSTSSNFGNEADLTVVYTYTNRVSFVGGISAFSPGDIFKETRGKDTSTWVYASTIINL